MKSYKVVFTQEYQNDTFNAILVDYFIVGSGASLVDALSDLQLAIKQTLCANQYDNNPPFCGLSKAPDDVIDNNILTTSVWF